ncbi:MAG: hypothetical protein J6O71_03630 [Lachnospiraceae bacterium]|nr:hypothetical protein [Lachnospiraceae bacterium]
MEAFAVIKAKLDLLVRLVDTTTGATVDERNVLFMRDERQVRPEDRGNGNYVFINTGREDFLMRIKVAGFEEYVARIRYEELDPNIPECVAFLIPSENAKRGESLYSLSGNLPFLEALEAINLSRIACTANEYIPKKLLLNVFSSAGAWVSLEGKYYGLLQPDKQSYEKIEVLGHDGPQNIRLKSPLEKEFTSNLPIMRIIFGSVSDDGDYLLRVRDDGGDQTYLVRYVVNGEVKFQVVDFYEGGELDPNKAFPTGESEPESRDEAEEASEAEVKMEEKG